MPTKRELLETYGEEREGQTVMVCPTCTDTTFETLEAWKDHMTREHGGYTSSEVASGQATSKEPGTSGGAGTSSNPSTPAPKPKRISQRARELNDKLNRCVSLVIKHLMSGIDEDERKEMEVLRTAITEAFVGVEFDFEERLVSLSGKWAVLVVLILLFILPALPSMKESIGKALAKARQKKMIDNQVEEVVN
jgi:hypothetical protein